jgi:hypothetical protein
MNTFLLTDPEFNRTEIPVIMIFLPDHILPLVPADFQNCSWLGFHFEVILIADFCIWLTEYCISDIRFNLKRIRKFFLVYKMRNINICCILQRY